MADHRDFRQLDMATQAALRHVAVALVAAGKTRGEATVGVNRRYVGEWVAPLRRALAPPPWPAGDVAAGRASRNGAVAAAGDQDPAADRRQVP